jgi:hypothetical protein
MFKISRRIGVVWVGVWLAAGVLQGFGVRQDFGPFNGKIYTDPSLRLFR